MWSENHAHREVGLLTHGSGHLQSVGISGFDSGFVGRQVVEVRLVNQNQVGSASPLEVECGVEVPALLVEVEVVIQNGAGPTAISETQEHTSVVVVAVVIIIRIIIVFDIEWLLGL
jgi:hypothetical protein